jgi:hypothetical protein
MEATAALLSAWHRSVFGVLATGALKELYTDARLKEDFYGRVRKMQDYRKRAQEDSEATSGMTSAGRQAYLVEKKETFRARKLAKKEEAKQPKLSKVFCDADTHTHTHAHTHCSG